MTRHPQAAVMRTTILIPITVAIATGFVLHALIFPDPDHAAMPIASASTAQADSPMTHPKAVHLAANIYAFVLAAEISCKHPSLKVNMDVFGRYMSETGISRGDISGDGWETDKLAALVAAGNLLEGGGEKQCAMAVTGYGPEGTVVKGLLTIRD